MAFFFRPPPPPPAPIGVPLPTGVDCDSYERFIFKPLENAFSSLAQSLQDLRDDPNEAHSHYLLTRFLTVMGDDSLGPIWPVLYPTSTFENSILGHLNAIREEFKDLPTPTLPPSQLPPNPLDFAPVVTAIEKGFKDLKDENATSLKSFADAVKSSAPPPPPKPKPKQAHPPPKKILLPQAVIRFRDHVDPESRPSFTDLVANLNNKLHLDNEYSHVRVVGVKWTTASNLLVRAQAPSPNILTNALQNVVPTMPFLGCIKDIIPNVKWSRVVLSSIPSGKTPDSPAYSSYSLHAELAAANPDYSDLTIRQFPSWLRNPDHLADGQLSSASFAFEDPDGSLARHLIGTSLTAFGNLRCVIKPWAPPKKPPQGN